MRKAPNVNHRGKNRHTEKRYLVEEKKCKEQKKASKIQEDTALITKKKGGGLLSKRNTQRTMRSSRVLKI